MIKHFRELDVWQKSDGLAHRVFDRTDTFPRRYLFDLTNQLRRAALSAPTNLAEGCATAHTKELLQFINISRRSISETQYLLLFALRRELITVQEHEQLTAAYEEVQRMLNALVTSLRQSHRARRVHAAGRLLVSALVFCQMFTSHWSPVTGHSSLAYAQVPNLVRYQGQAVDANSVPMEGPYNLTFRLYNAETAGAIVWQETQANVTLTKGNFSILLGQVTPLTVDWSVPLWLSIQVGIESELSPRQRITSVPLAIRAETAESLVGGGTDTSARVSNNASLSIANATETYLTFNTEQWDTNTIHDTSLNTDRLTATTAGKYYVFATVLFADNATGTRQVTIEHSGCGCDIARFTQKAADSGFVGGVTLGTHYNFSAGQYVRVRVYQNSGGALNLIANGVFPSFGMVKVE